MLGAFVSTRMFSELFVHRKNVPLFELFLLPVYVVVTVDIFCISAWCVKENVYIWGLAIPLCFVVSLHVLCIQQYRKLSFLI